MKKDYRGVERSLPDAITEPIFLAAITGLCANLAIGNALEKASMTYASTVVGIAERIVDEVDARARARAK